MISNYSFTLIFGFAFLLLLQSEGCSAEESAPIVPLLMATEVVPGLGKPVQIDPAAPVEEYVGKAGTIETWEFEITLQAFQHEPANQSLDEFDSKLHFAAIFSQGKTVSQTYAGFGQMTAFEISRAPNSDQAPHRPQPTFVVLADAQIDHAKGVLHVKLQPQDAVTYSLLSGPVLGTTSILQYILPDATGSGVQGNLQEFSIPLTTKAGAEFECRFDTSDQHVCWYEGKASLRVVSHSHSRYDEQGKYQGSVDPSSSAEPDPPHTDAPPAEPKVDKNGKPPSQAK